MSIFTRATVAKPASAAVLFLTLFATAPPAAAIAADCPPEWGDECTIAAQLRDSRAVAIVRVVGALHLPGSDDDDDYTGGDIYTLQPVEVLKGTVPTRFATFSENTSGRFPLDVGRTYLLFLGRGKNDVLWYVQMGWRGNSGLLAEKPATLARVRQLIRAQRPPPACTIDTVCRTASAGSAEPG
jgi:hypothetical protein